MTQCDSGDSPTLLMQLAANLSLLFDPDTPWPERCERVAAQGFRFAEILFPYDHSASHYRKWLDAAGLQAVLINTPINGHFGLAAVEGAEKQFRQDLAHSLAVGQELGVKAIHVMAGRQTQKSSVSLTCLLRNLEHAVKQAEETEIVLMLEALNRHDAPGYFYRHPQEVTMVLQALPSSKLRQQFDFYHTLREGLPLLDELERCLPYIGHVQIAQPPARNEPDLLQGPMLPALRYLAARGYQGWLGCEYHPADSFESGLKWLTPLKRLNGLRSDNTDGVRTDPEYRR